MSVRPDLLKWDQLPVSGVGSSPEIFFDTSVASGRLLVLDSTARTLTVEGRTYSFASELAPYILLRPYRVVAGALEFVGVINVSPIDIRFFSVDLTTGVLTAGAVHRSSTRRLVSFGSRFVVSPRTGRFYFATYPGSFGDAALIVSLDLAAPGPSMGERIELDQNHALFEGTTLTGIEGSLELDPATGDLFYAPGDGRLLSLDAVAQTARLTATGVPLGDVANSQVTLMTDGEGRLFAWARPYAGAPALPKLYWLDPALGRFLLSFTMVTAAAAGAVNTLAGYGGPAARGPIFYAQLTDGVLYRILPSDVGLVTRVSVDTPQGVQSGLVPIHFKLFDPTGARAYLGFKWSDGPLNVGTPGAAAILDPVTQRPFPADKFWEPGVEVEAEYVVLWYSNQETQLGDAFSEDIHFRVTGSLGTADTLSFSVDNTNALATEAARGLVAGAPVVFEVTPALIEANVPVSLCFRGENLIESFDRIVLVGPKTTLALSLRDLSITEGRYARTVAPIIFSRAGTYRLLLVNTGHRPIGTRYEMDAAFVVYASSERIDVAPKTALVGERVDVDVEVAGFPVNLVRRLLFDGPVPLAYTSFTYFQEKLSREQPVGELFLDTTTPDFPSLRITGAAFDKAPKVRPGDRYRFTRQGRAYHLVMREPAAVDTLVFQSLTPEEGGVPYEVGRPTVTRVSATTLRASGGFLQTPLGPRRATGTQELSSTGNAVSTTYHLWAVPEVAPDTGWTFAKTTGANPGDGVKLALATTTSSGAWDTVTYTTEPPATEAFTLVTPEREAARPLPADADPSAGRWKLRRRGVLFPIIGSYPIKLAGDAAGDDPLGPETTVLSVVVDTTPKPSVSGLNPVQVEPYDADLEGLEVVGANLDRLTLGRIRLVASARRPDGSLPSLSFAPADLGLDPAAGEFRLMSPTRIDFGTIAKALLIPGIYDLRFEGAAPDYALELLYSRALSILDTQPPAILAIPVPGEYLVDLDATGNFSPFEVRLYALRHELPVGTRLDGMTIASFETQFLIPEYVRTFDAEAILYASTAGANPPLTEHTRYSATRPITLSDEVTVVRAVALDPAGNRSLPFSGTYLLKPNMLQHRARVSVDGAAPEPVTVAGETTGGTQIPVPAGHYVLRYSGGTVQRIEGGEAWYRAELRYIVHYPTGSTGVGICGVLGGYVSPAALKAAVPTNTLPLELVLDRPSTLIFYFPQVPGAVSTGILRYELFERTNALPSEPGALEYVRAKTTNETVDLVRRYWDTFFRAPGATEPALPPGVVQTREGFAVAPALLLRALRNALYRILLNDKIGTTVELVLGLPKLQIVGPKLLRVTPGREIFPEAQTSPHGRWDGPRVARRDEELFDLEKLGLTADGAYKVWVTPSAAGRSYYDIAIQTAATTAPRLGVSVEVGGFAITAGAVISSSISSNLVPTRHTSTHLTDPEIGRDPTFAALDLHWREIEIALANITLPPAILLAPSPGVPALDPPQLPGAQEDPTTPPTVIPPSSIVTVPDTTPPTEVPKPQGDQSTAPGAGPALSSGVIVETSYTITVTDTASFQSTITLPVAGFAMGAEIQLVRTADGLRLQGSKNATGILKLNIGPAIEFYSTSAAGPLNRITLDATWTGGVLYTRAPKGVSSLRLPYRTENGAANLVLSQIPTAGGLLVVALAGPVPFAQPVPAALAVRPGSTDARIEGGSYRVGAIALVLAPAPVSSTDVVSAGLPLDVVLGVTAVSGSHPITEVADWTTLQWAGALRVEPNAVTIAVPAPPLSTSSKPIFVGGFTYQNFRQATPLQLYTQPIVVTASGQQSGQRSIAKTESRSYTLTITSGSQVREGPVQEALAPADVSSAQVQIRFSEEAAKDHTLEVKDGGQFVEVTPTKTGAVPQQTFSLTRIGHTPIFRYSLKTASLGAIQGIGFELSKTPPGKPRTTQLLSTGTVTIDGPDNLFYELRAFPLGATGARVGMWFSIATGGGAPTPPVTTTAGFRTAIDPAHPPFMSIVARTIGTPRQTVRAQVIAKDLSTGEATVANLTLLFGDAVDQITGIRLVFYKRAIGDALEKPPTPLVLNATETAPGIWATTATVALQEQEVAQFVAEPLGPASSVGLARMTASISSTGTATDPATPTSASPAIKPGSPFTLPAPLDQFRRGRELYGTSSNKTYSIKVWALDTTDGANLQKLTATVTVGPLATLEALDILVQQSNVADGSVPRTRRLEELPVDVMGADNVRRIEARDFDTLRIWGITRAPSTSRFVFVEQLQAASRPRNAFLDPSALLTVDSTGTLVLVSGAVDAPFLIGETSPLTAFPGGDEVELVRPAPMRAGDFAASMNKEPAYFNVRAIDATNVHDYKDKVFLVRIVGPVLLASLQLRALLYDERLSTSPAEIPLVAGGALSGTGTALDPFVLNRIAVTDARKPLPRTRLQIDAVPTFSLNFGDGSPVPADEKQAFFQGLHSYPDTTQTAPDLAPAGEGLLLDPSRRFTVLPLLAGEETRPPVPTVADLVNESGGTDPTPSDPGPPADGQTGLIRVKVVGTGRGSTSNKVTLEIYFRVIVTGQ